MPLIQVAIGNLVYVVGQLRYQRSETADHGGGGGGTADYWIVGSAVVGGAMLTVIIIILVVYKRKSSRAQRQFKRLQLQLDALESNIRNECKQGAQRRNWGRGVSWVFEPPPLEISGENLTHKTDLLLVTKFSKVTTGLDSGYRF